MRIAVVVSCLLFSNCLTAAEPGVTRAGIEFFESKVRPLLAEHCWSCHGAKKQEAGLRLDSRTALLKGSDAGPVVIPGNPDKSKLIAAVRQDGNLKMPKDGKKLAPMAVEILAQWIKAGVPFPASAEKDAAAKIDPRQHWAFQPLKAVTPPECREASTPLDRFVLPKLQEKGLSFSPLADKRTLARRAYFDLLGLPPTVEELEAFLADTSPNAFEKLVDRLLASPQYGEAQARHWLDLSRYADTKGYVFQEDRNYPFAYTYRDWVIRAFNEDMPYDRFIKLQIAADRMNSPDKRDLAALGFQTLGRRFLNSIPDIIDDRLDVTFRTFLGLTIACARCHDHKFDPIPTKDYYSLYGVFASSTEPKDLPLIGESARTPEVIAFEEQSKKLEDQVKALTEKQFNDNLAKMRRSEVVAAYMLATNQIRGGKGDDSRGQIRQRDLNPFVFDRWRRHLEEETRQHSPIFAAWKALSSIPADRFNQDAAQAALNKLAADAMSKKLPLNSLVMAELKEARLGSMSDVSAIYARLMTGGPPNAGPDQKALSGVLGKDGPLDISMENANRLFNTAERNKITEARRKADAFKATSPSAPPRAMVLNDSPNPFNPYVFLRGNQNNRGPSVPRQFLQVLSGPDRKPFTQGSGRLELANAIADPKNPLTARVMANRLWMTHFGHGLVRTPSDFGIRTELPTQPQLLDWLANQFIESGWSVKKMHRLIMLSRTYQQASQVGDSQDVENRLLGRMNRRRYDFETLRDGMLLVAGHLDRNIGGRPVDIFKEPFTHRRTIYGFIDRQNLPGTFRVFDFASPDNHSPQRYSTTVPQQALFLLNSPFVVAQARGLVSRVEVKSQTSTPGRIEQIYRVVYGRAPTKEETTLATRFVEQPDEKTPENGKPSGLTRLEQLAQVLLLSNEFAFVD